MDVSGYRHNYGGFYEKTSYQMSINRGRMTTIQGAHASFLGILSFFSSLQSFEEEIQPFRDCVDTARG